VKKSVTHISFSSAGGAGSVARTLVQGQRETGRVAHFAHVIDSDLRSAPFATPAHTLAAGLDHYVIKSPGFNAPISVARDVLGGNLDESLSGAEVLHLHGYNGALRLGDLGRMAEGKRVVWTLHDMNPFTGACHYSLGCTRYSESCQSCPAVRSLFRPSVERALVHKVEALRTIDDLRVVAPSQWLADAAASSTVFQGHDIRVIPNPVTTLDTDGRADTVASAPGTKTAGDFVATVIARNLSDPVKNVRAAFEAFRLLRATTPGATLRLIGAGGEEFTSDGVELLGPLATADIAQELQSSDVLIVPSLAENAPLVIIEAAWVGCPSVVSNVGGMPEIVARLGAGSVFTSPEDLVDALASMGRESARASQSMRGALQATVRATYSPQAVVAQYDELYD
jgi:glycosyltransferase involved in cell wall biosynthesis